MSVRFRFGIIFIALLALASIWRVQEHIDVRLLAHASANLSSTAASKNQDIGRGINGTRDESSHSGARVADVLSATGPTPGKLKQISPEAAFCKIMNANARIPIGGILKVWTYSYEVDEEGQPGFVSLVQSTDCPIGLFSKVRMDNLGRIKEEVDCRTATKEEILTRSGIQGNIEDHPSTESKLNLAISGDGCNPCVLRVLTG